MWKAHGDFLDFEDKNIDWNFILEETVDLECPSHDVDYNTSETAPISGGITPTVGDEISGTRRDINPTQLVQYACPFCGKVYKSASGFRGHVKKIHEKDVKASLYKVKNGTGTYQQQNTESGTEIEDTTVHTEQASAMGSNDSTRQTRKTGFSRPTPLYHQGQLKSEIPGMVVQALAEIADDVNLKVKGSVHGHTIASIAIDLVCKLKLGEISIPDDVVNDLTSRLWNVITAGDNEKTYSSHNEEIWSSFYCMWSNQDLTKTMIYSFQPCLSSNVSYADLFRTVRLCLFNLIAVVRHRRDETDYANERSQQKETDMCRMDEEEEKALRYFAGYIPYNLMKKNMRKESAASKEYIAILESMRDTSDVQSSSKMWVDKLDKGGLFKVSDTAYLFFKEMELICRNHLKTEEIVGYHGQNIYKPLVDEILEKESIHRMWSSLSRKASIDVISNAVLSSIVRLYVNIRCFSFARSVVEVYKRKNRKHLKGSKGLRKTLV
ncbi:uncharacterized protein [Ptychodera flava]|uniref:uncharacterized protein n=1 Tax=Ptychodera flava TaxID=63121 RepID=UPI003969C0A7